MRVAVVRILATGGAFPALFADAGEGVSSSHTSPSVGTRTGGACAVLGCVACVPPPSGRAGTAEGIAVVVAGTAIAAGGGVTLALPGMASLALPVVGTLAVEVVHEVNTASFILARVAPALVNIEVAELSLPAVSTEALEGVHSINAGPAIFTGVANAVIDILMTVDSTEPWVADTGEVACWLADAASSGSANIGGYVANFS